MRRYPHYLRRARGQRHPPRVLCVDCCSVYEPAGGVGRVRSERLTAWYAVALLRQGGRYHYHSEYAGCSVDQWADLLDRCLARPGETWVVSEHCPRVWPLLDVYRMIEDGVLVLAEDPDPTRRAAGAEPAHALDGYLIAGDIPCVLVCRYRDRPGRLVWIDARNHGAECPEDVSDGAARCRTLASWVISLTSALSTLHLGSLQHTAGSQAYHGYRVGYYAGGIYVHAHESALRLEERGYYGGRCECYYLGVVPEDSYHYDYRSLYPWVMMHQAVPMRLVGYTDDAAAAQRIVGRTPERCLADVTIETQTPDYPYRRHEDIIYPVGRYRTVLPGPELQRAVRRGHVVAVHAVAWYDMGCPLYRYARALYDWRCACEQSGDRMLAASAKALLVCLPGKMGQRLRRWVPAPEVIPDYPWGEWYAPGPDGGACRYRCLGLQTQREWVGGAAPDAVMQIAAWITSAGRMRLLEAIEAAGWPNVYYVDTDCVVTGYLGVVGLRAAGLTEHDGPGWLRRKHGPCKTEIRGIKYYIVDEHITCAGMPRGAKRDTGDGVHYWHRVTPAEAIRHGLRPEAREVLCSYQRTEAYRHGHVQPDGRVTPIEFKE